MSDTGTSNGNGGSSRVEREVPFRILDCCALVGINIKQHIEAAGLCVCLCLCLCVYVCVCVNLLRLLNLRPSILRCQVKAGSTSRPPNRLCFDAFP